MDAFERFLRRTYLGQKTFSIEGVDALVPITDQVIELMAAEGTAEVVLGMAHRGRLAFITQVVGRPPSRSWPSSRATWPSSRARRRCARPRAT